MNHGSGNGPWAEVNLKHLQANFGLVRHWVGPGVDIIPVVKANAYGHGAAPVAQCLEAAGAAAVAVASVQEGIHLRDNGITGPIVLLDYLLPGQAHAAVAHHLSPTVHTVAVIRALELAAGELGMPVAVHLRIETHAGTLGVPVTDLQHVLQTLAQAEGVRAEAIYTHLTEAYAGGRPEVIGQLARFQEALALAQAAGVAFSRVHAASSPAILDFPETYFAAVRPGTMLYGLTSRENQGERGLQPVMQLKARVTHVQEFRATYIAGYDDHVNAGRVERVATVPMGYGVARFLLSLQDGEVLLRGKRVPILGKPRMSNLLVDATRVPEVQPYDEVVFFGRQEGAAIRAEELAARSGIGVLNCESVCMLDPDVTRVYTNGEGCP